MQNLSLIFPERGRDQKGKKGKKLEGKSFKIQRESSITRNCFLACIYAALWCPLLHGSFHGPDRCVCSETAPGIPGLCWGWSPVPCAPLATPPASRLSRGASGTEAQHAQEFTSVQLQTCFQFMNVTVYQYYLF